MADTQFSPGEDVVGRETLELFAETDEFNKWLFQALSPYCSNKLFGLINCTTFSTSGKSACNAGPTGAQPHTW